MEFKQSNFQKENKENHLTSEERTNLVKDKYLTTEGKGNELFAEICLKYFMRIIAKILGKKYSNYLEDLVQIATLKATIHLGQFAGDSSLQSWLFKIASNETFDFLRKAKYRKDISQGESLDDILITKEDIADPLVLENAILNVDLLENIFKDLDEYQKHILSLHYMQGYSVKEMVDMLGVNESNLKIQLFRARRKAAEYAKMKGLKK